jgi:hypothetical protein
MYATVQEESGMYAQLWKGHVQAVARTQGHLLGRTAASVLVISFHVISQQKVFC